MDTIDSLTKEYNLDERLIELLVSRGIDTSEKLSRFINPSLDNLTPISAYPAAIDAAKVIKNGIIEKKRFLIYGDYDCDGICSVAILFLHLSDLGADVNYFIPNRHDDGYGINLEAVIKLKEKYSPDIMITVDCGISAVKEIEYIQQNLGISVIITDHHILPDKLPNCIAFDPKDSFGYKDLSGAGVAMRLIEAISGQGEMIKYLDIAAISSIADIVPLIEDNRVIVTLGLEMIKKSPRRGIKFLMDKAKAKAIASDIAYKIAPRINASGRLTDANKVVELFTSEDYFLLQAIVQDIDDENRERRLLTDTLYEEALIELEKYDLKNNRVIILHKPNWDIGILGIAAARISREFNLPTILMTELNGTYKGSGRSVEGIDMHSLLLPLSQLFTAFGGHSQAVGLTIDMLKFNHFFCSAKIAFNAAYDNDNEVKKDYVTLDSIGDIKLFKDIQKLEPFGSGNLKPQFRITTNDYNYTPISNTEHIKALAAPSVEITGFNMLKYINIFNSNFKSEIIADLNINAYNGWGQAIINSIEFDISDKSLTIEDYFDAIYLKQMFYSDVRNTNYIEFDDIDKIIGYSKEQFGTLFIASRLNTCYNVKKYIPKLPLFVLQKDKLSPKTGLLLAPYEFNSSKYYDRLVFLDKPLKNGYIERFIHQGIHETYVIKQSEGPQIKVASERINQIIDKIKELTRYGYKSTEDLYYRLNKSYPCGYGEFATAFYIMYELKALSIGKDFKLNVRDIEIILEESEVFRRINEH
jgi:single-stranded-DNA-specific exonuclease